MSRWLRAILLVVALLVAPLAQADDGESTRIGGVDVVVWTPPTPVPPRWPVVIFSHGMYMCPTQSSQLTRSLADAGYLVIAPRHSDSTCKVSLWADFSRLGMKPSLWWTDRDYRDRADDIRRVAEALPEDSRYAGSIVPGELALVGHSLGGYTVLGLAGAWPSWRLPGVRAVVALTPYSLPFRRSEGLSRLTVPVMYQVGALDPMFTLPLEAGGYAQTPSPKMLVEIAWANHLAWTDIGFGNQDAIVDYATAFLDHYVKGVPEAPALHAALPGVTSLRRN
jgi:predicted dienelactone hydrolase